MTTTLASDANIAERIADMAQSIATLVIAGLIIAFLVTSRLSKSDKRHKIADAFCQKMEELIIAYYIDNLSDTEKQRLLGRFYICHTSLANFVMINESIAASDKNKMMGKLISLFETASLHDTIKALSEIRYHLTR